MSVIAAVALIGVGTYTYIQQDNAKKEARAAADRAAAASAASAAEMAQIERDRLAQEREISKQGSLVAQRNSQAAASMRGRKSAFSGAMPAASLGASGVGDPNIPTNKNRGNGFYRRTDDQLAASAPVATSLLGRK